MKERHLFESNVVVVDIREYENNDILLSYDPDTFQKIVNISGQYIDKMDTKKDITVNNISELVDKVYAYRFKSNKNMTESDMVHILHLILNVLDYFKKDEDFIKIFVYTIIFYKLKLINKFGTDITDTILDIFKSTPTSANILKLYMDLYNISEKTLKRDLYKYLVTVIIKKYDNIVYNNYAAIYSHILYEIFLYHLKTKLEGIVNYNLINNFFGSDSGALSNNSSRDSIYINGYYLYYLTSLYNNSSDTVDIINSNFEKIKENILKNEIQSLFLKSNNIPQSSNEKNNLIVTINELNSNAILQSAPLINNLLQSIKIYNSDSEFDKKRKYNYIKDNLKSYFYLKFKDKIPSNMLTIVSENISEELAEYLTNGKYINILNMEEIDVSSLDFINQFKMFLDVICN
jgi:hypothetical protein